MNSEKNALKQNIAGNSEEKFEGPGALSNLSTKPHWGSYFQSGGLQRVLHELLAITSKSTSEKNNKNAKIELSKTEARMTPVFEVQNAFRATHSD